jgi:dsRNA-specific ribonuclease
MATLPPLPQIVGDVDLLLDVYTHRSLVLNGAPMNEEYGDTDRLADLGARVLDLTVTLHYYSRRPMLSISEIAVCPLSYALPRIIMLMRIHLLA